MTVRRMVEVRRTVTVISRVPVESYSTGHSLKSDGRQMDQDEITNFEMRANAGEHIKEELTEALIEALQMEPADNQDHSVRVIFYDEPIEPDDKPGKGKGRKDEEVAPQPEDPIVFPG